MSILGADELVDRATSAPHLAPLAGDWCVWRTVVLRGAGFPADVVSRLAGGCAAAAARAYLDARSRRREIVASLLAAVRAQIAAASDPPIKTSLRAIERRLRRGRSDLPSPASGAPSSLADARERLTAAEDRERQAFAALAAALEHDAGHVDTALADLLADARVREAILWQNPASLRFARANLARPADSGRHRRAVELLARVAQRLAVKNDTYSFFGPVGWAACEDGGEYVRQTTAEAFVARSGVYFEGWAIDALAARVDRDKLLTRWAAPRLTTSGWLGDDGLYTARVGPIVLSAVERRVIGACDGVRTLDEVVALVAGATTPPTARHELLDVLSRLVAKGLVVCKIEVASQLHPEHDLERRLAGIGDLSSRDGALHALRSLVEARDRLADCAGDPERLEAALESLHDVFTRVTGRSPRRRHGQTYAARGVIYQDCRRGGAVTFGRPFLDKLGPPLAIVLDAARWLIGEVAQSVSSLLRDCHARHRPPTGAMPAEPFIDAAKRMLGGETGQQLFVDLEGRFQAAWHEVLGEPIGEGPGERRYDLAAARQRASRVLAPRAEGWCLARYLSPDVMVVADGPEAFERGDFTFVLGELHCSNTARWSMFAAQHPAPHELQAAVEYDMDGRVFVVTQAPKPTWLARMNPLLVPPTFWRYESTADLPNAPACRRLPAGLLVAIDDGATIKVRARDGSFECEAIEMFGEVLSPMTSRITGRLQPAYAHTPRIVLGDLTIGRESWDMTPADLPFLDEPDRLQRFAQVTAWRDAHGMPRWVFYKPSHEPKPIYLDFDSPLYVDVFVKLVKRAGRAPAESVRIVEMLPRADQTWLVDAHRRRYTSELRLVTLAPRDGRCLHRRFKPSESRT